MAKADDTPIPSLDENMIEERRSARDRENMHHDGSPPKVRKAASEKTEGVSVDLLKTLLAEQQTAILAAQRAAIRDGVGEAIRQLEERQDAKIAKVEARSMEQDTRLSEMALSLDLLQKKVQNLESGSTRASSAAGSSDLDPSRNRNALVLGGFPRDSRRKTILDVVNGALQRLELQKLIDTDPFTTRPRSSFALLRFEKREGETNEGVKDRMHQVLNGIIRGRVKIAHQDKPMWAGFSKTKQEREKAQHCGTIREVIRYFNPDALEVADFDYNTGTTWIGESMVGSAVDKIPPDEDAARMFYSNLPHKGWINVHALSKELQADADELQEHLKGTSR